jgi:hypothetical protein
MKIPRHSLTSDYLFYSKRLIKKRQMDIFIKKWNILYKDNQIERIIEIDFNFDPFIINRIQNSKEKNK